MDLVGSGSERNFSWRDWSGEWSSGDVLGELSEVDSSVSVSVVLAHQIVQGAVAERSTVFGEDLSHLFDVDHSGTVAVVQVEVSLQVYWRQVDVG